MALTQAVLLCGGVGSRLGTLTASTPKPLLDVAGTPFLERLLGEMRRFGIRRFLLLAAYHADQIEAFLRSARDRLDVCGEVVVEPELAGTGGALWNARDRLDETFLLLNADSWFDINPLDLGLFLEAHPKAVAALALRRIEDSGRYGTVDLDGARVSGFREKTALAAPGIVNGGVYAMRKAVVERLAPKCSLERDVLPELVEEGRVAGRIYDGFFLDIGVPEDYRRSQALVPAAQTRGAVFLDRDGVLNDDKGYVGEIERFEWLPGAIEGVKRINDLGLFAFVVTNQAGVARGFFDEAAVAAVHAALSRDLARAGAHIDDFRYCPFHPDGTVPAYTRVSDWRKPEPGMLLDLLSRWPVDISRSVMIGDKQSDVIAAERAGVRGYLLAPGETLDQAVCRIKLDRIESRIGWGSTRRPNC
jgi:D-glycero-D-manno-heptose 1,7-bisphosphate phosphatase